MEPVHLILEQVVPGPARPAAVCGDLAARDLTTTGRLVTCQACWDAVQGVEGTARADRVDAERRAVVTLVEAHRAEFEDLVEREAVLLALDPDWTRARPRRWYPRH